MTPKVKILRGLEHLRPTKSVTKRSVDHFRPNFVQSCKFHFLSKMLNFAILSVFCPKRICLVHTHGWHIAETYSMWPESAFYNTTVVTIAAYSVHSLQVKKDHYFCYIIRQQTHNLSQKAPSIISSRLTLGAGAELISADSASVGRVSCPAGGW